MNGKAFEQNLTKSAVTFDFFYVFCESYNFLNCNWNFWYGTNRRRRKIMDNILT